MGGIGLSTTCCHLSNCWACCGRLDCATGSCCKACLSRPKWANGVCGSGLASLRLERAVGGCAVEGLLCCGCDDVWLTMPGCGCQGIDC